MRSAVVLLACLIWSGTASGQTVFDFYTQFNTSSNSASDTWQYVHGINLQGGVNTFSLETTYLLNNQSKTGWNVWGASNGSDSAGYVGIVASDAPSSVNGVAAGHGFVLEDNQSGDPNPQIGAGIGFKAPATGDYSFSFTLTATDTSNSGQIAWYFQNNNSGGTLLAGFLDHGTSATRTISQSMTAGQIAYLIVGPTADGSAYDSTQVDFSVTAVPEPATYAAIAGLMALGLAWGHRRLGKRRRLQFL